MSLTEFYGWIVQHSQLAGLAVFFIAMAESMAMVGLLVPGVAMMFGAGALIGTGALPFGPVCAYAVAGAIAGDVLSFWAGWQFRDRLLALWPFSRYPAMIQGGIDYFRRYGGRSILFGRFVGPVRAVIPLVAGMMAMSLPRFLAIEVFSALLWAPAYLLPGMVFGASIDLASQVATRLAVLASALLALLWFTAWLSKRLYGYFRPRAQRFIVFTLDVCQSHPRLGRLTLPLIDPDQRDTAGLLVWAALLAAVAMAASLLIPADSFAVSLDAWRQPLADYVLRVLEDWGQPDSILVFSAAIAIWLLIRRHRLAASHAVLGIGLALALGDLSGRLFRVPLVDGPVLNATVAFGFVAVLVADRAEAAWRWLAYSTAALGSVCTAFARLYFGNGELIAMAFTLVLATVWLILLGVAYRRHAPPEKPAMDLAWIAFAVYLVVTGALIQRHSLEEFRYPMPPIGLAEQDWLEHDWKNLSLYRVQAFGRPQQLLAVQWAARLDEIHAVLVREGWRTPPQVGLVSLLKTLNPAADLADLPVLPHFNQSEVDVLRLIKRTPEGRWEILRFWASGYRLEDRAVPVWLGSIAYLRPWGIPGLLKFSEETPYKAAPENALAGELRRQRYSVERTTADGHTIILIRPCSD